MCKLAPLLHHVTTPQTPVSSLYDVTQLRDDRADLDNQFKADGDKYCHRHLEYGTIDFEGLH